MPYKDPDVARAKSREYCRKWRAANPGWQKKTPSYGKRYSIKTPEAAAAHTALQRAIASGRIVRPDFCGRCNVSCRPEAAHHDYRRQLQVEWLCQPCHRTWDAEHPKHGTWSLGEHAAWQQARPAAITRLCETCGTEVLGRRRSQTERYFCSMRCYNLFRAV